MEGQGDRGNPARVSSAADQDHGGAWQTIHNGRKNNHDVVRSTMFVSQAQGGRPRNPNFQDIRKVSTSFFICNFPPNVTVSGLWGRCEEWETVSDVYIANHLSKSGHRFGFVRFLRVEKVEEMVKNLRSMWFGNFKVYADVVKFPTRPSERKSVVQSKFVRKDKVVTGNSCSAASVPIGDVAIPVKMSSLPAHAKSENIKSGELDDIDHLLDDGGFLEDRGHDDNNLPAGGSVDIEAVRLKRRDLVKSIQESERLIGMDLLQKSKDPGEIKNGFLDFFKSKYRSFQGVRMRNLDDKFRKLSVVERVVLEGIPTLDEVKEAVWSCG
ncbi:hypothetical protein SSX86_010889 [Deinandra increscens subsp. villosa]|uniref:RRM domain-containing protein n=1 Tax=Deinandra increscens subsp. villosa TaxID=3103831 RepID=A0AAP0DDB7_9ASTR